MKKMTFISIAKRAYIIFLSVFIIGIAASCSTKNQPKPGSGGKTCEILVVCDKNVYTGTISDSLSAFFEQYQTGLNQAEPMFKLSVITPEAFNDADMFQHMRNIIIISINKKNPNKFAFSKDLLSFPQIIFNFNYTTKEKFLEAFSAKKEMMRTVFYDNERIRIIKTFKTTENIDIKTSLKKNFGFDLVFPDGFEIAKTTSHYSWIRKESKDYGQGMLIYTYPYADANVFDNNKIITILDSMTKKVPGPTQGSFMTTEKEFKPVSKPITFNNRYAIETRGLWRLIGDFMGGPFVSYTFTDNANKNVIVLFGYVYAPQKDKRDLLLQMESIAYSFKEIENNITSDSNKISTK